jgi:hypothetical protein
MLTIDDVIERFDGSLAYSTNSKEICQYIADLLKELKERRKEPEIITCGECMYREIRGIDGFCDHITGEEIMVRKTDYCSWAERRTDENNNLYV